MPVPTTVHPSSLTWLGASHESVYGTSAIGAAAPFFTLPLDASSFSPEDKPIWLRDIALRGSNAELFAMVQGVKNSAWSLGGPFYPGLSPFLIDNMMGDLVTTPTGGTAGTTTTTTANSAVGATTLTVTSITGFSSGQTCKIAQGAFSDFFVISTAPAGSTLTFTNTPLHFAYTSGAVVTPYTVTPTSFSHKFSSLNIGTAQPPTHSLVDVTYDLDTLSGGSPFDKWGARVYTSLCTAQLDFVFSAEQMVTAKAQGTAWASQDSNALGATGQYTAGAVSSIPTPSWNTSIQLSLPDTGGAVTVNYAGEVSISLKRKIQVYWTNDGSQNPYFIARGPLSVTGAVVATVAQDEQLLSSMTKNFQGSMLVTATVPSTTPYSASEQGNTLSFAINQAAFTAAKPARSAVLLGYESTFEAVANSTNAGASGGLSPVAITCVDTTATY